MRILIQRVKRANVIVKEKEVANIGEGYLLFVSFTNTDNNEVADKMIDKLLKLRINEDSNEKMNLSIRDIKGEILSVSQFTLYAGLKKGNRPSFTDCLNMEDAANLFEYFNDKLRESDVNIQTGIFQAYMDIELINSGPATFLLDSQEIMGGKNGK